MKTEAKSLPEVYCPYLAKITAIIWIAVPPGEEIKILDMGAEGRVCTYLMN